MYNINDEFKFKSENGMTYKIIIININEWREPEARYGADVWDGNGNYAGDVMFFGNDFLDKCEKIQK